MFDNVPTEVRDNPTILARCLFLNYGHDLAKSAAMLGGASAEARVVSCALNLGERNKITSQVRRDLIFIHKLFSQEFGDDPECLETSLLSSIDPASTEVDTICLLTEMLETILQEISAFNRLGDKRFTLDVFLSN